MVGIGHAGGVETGFEAWSQVGSVAGDGFGCGLDIETGNLIESETGSHCLGRTKVLLRGEDFGVSVLTLWAWRLVTALVFGGRGRRPRG